MTCTACGEKPKDTAKGFTKAVIEINNPGKLTLFRKVLIPSSLGDETAVPPTIGKYHNVLLEYEINQHLYLYSSDGIPTQLSADMDELREALEDEISTRAIEDDLLDTKIEDETESRQLADSNLQSQIDSIAASSDVKDIVGTYAELQQYDTSTLGNNDIIKVLQDETQSDATTYYRWSTSTQTFTLIGEEGPYYTKSATDALLADKQGTLIAGENITISNNVISASGGGSVTPVQTTGTSTIDVMSQNATTGMVYADPATKLQVQVGDSANGASTYAVAIGANSKASNRCVAIGGGSSLVIERTRATGDNCVALGAGAQADNSYSTAVGGSARAGGQYSLALGYGATSPATCSYAIALGAGARTAHIGEMNIGTGAGSGNGYNSSDYRLISGVYDPQSAHDAATKGYVDIATANIPATFTAQEWSDLWD